MRDELDQLLALHAVVESAPEMTAQLIGPIERDERRHGDQAAVALSEARPFPHVAEHHLVGELAELRKNIPDLADSGRQRTCSHCEPPGKLTRTTLSCVE